jgi:hypothetical protein
MPEREAEVSRARTRFYFMRQVLIVLVLVALLVIVAWRVASDSPYLYDEADYMYVTQLGIVANFTDTPTMPIVEFLRTGLTRGKDSRQSSQLSELIRGANDVVFYRHWHGPLYIYWLMLTSHLHLDEHRMRLFTLVFPICSLVVIYWGCIWIFGETQGTWAAFLGSLLFVWSVPTVRSTELAPHQAFACCFLACLVLLSKTVATGNRRYFYWAVVASALSCCLLEVGFVVVATVIICGYLERRSLRADRRLATHSLLAFVATVLVVWPGAILKLSFLKGYLFMAYLALFRKSPWGPEGLRETWEKRIFSSPVEWLIIGVGLLTWAFSRRLEGHRRVLYPFFAYGALMLATTMRVTTGTPRYALLFQPAFDVLAGCILAAYFLRFRRLATAYALAGILALVLFTEAWVNLKRHPVVPDSRLSSLLVYVREKHLENSRMLVPQDDVPTLHYYFPNTHLRGYTEQIPRLSRLQDGRADGLLYPGLPLRYEPLLSGDFN